MPCAPIFLTIIFADSLRRSCLRYRDFFAFFAFRTGDARFLGMKVKLYIVVCYFGSILASSDAYKFERPELVLDFWSSENRRLRWRLSSAVMFRILA